MLNTMQRLPVILCALSSVVFASGLRVDIAGSHVQSGSDHRHHEHKHYHDGSEHSHWHSHSGHTDHSDSDPKDDHHDEMGGHDHGDLPLFPPPIQTAQGRQSIGKILLLCQTGINCQLEPPALVPPKPPPKHSLDEDDLSRLRTVILLT